jgi:hypothetical protein
MANENTPFNIVNKLAFRVYRVKNYNSETKMNMKLTKTNGGSYCSYKPERLLKYSTSCDRQ